MAWINSIPSHITVFIAAFILALISGAILLPLLKRLKLVFWSGDTETPTVGTTGSKAIEKLRYCPPLLPEMDRSLQGTAPMAATPVKVQQLPSQ